MSSIKSIIREIFWQERYLPIFWGIALIFAGIYAYSKSIEQEQELNLDNYITISDYLSEDIIIVDNSKSGSEYILFKLVTKKYEFIDFQIKHIFNELDIPKIRAKFIEGNKISVWIKKDLYYQILNLSQIYHSNGEKKLHGGLFEVYMLSINNQSIFDFSDLVNHQKNQKWIGLLLGLIGLIFLIIPITVKDPNKISFYGTLSLAIFSFITLTVYFLIRLLN